MSEENVYPTFKNVMESYVGKEADDIKYFGSPNTDVSMMQMLTILCWEIEKLPPSDQQTKVITLACELRNNITKECGWIATRLNSLKEQNE